MILTDDLNIVLVYCRCDFGENLIPKELMAKVDSLEDKLYILDSSSCVSKLERPAATSLEPGNKKSVVDAALKPCDLGEGAV